MENNWKGLVVNRKCPICGKNPDYIEVDEHFSGPRGFTGNKVMVPIYTCECSEVIQNNIRKYIDKII